MQNVSQNPKCHKFAIKFNWLNIQILHFVYEPFAQSTSIKNRKEQEVEFEKTNLQNWKPMVVVLPMILKYVL